MTHRDYTTHAFSPSLRLTMKLQYTFLAALAIGKATASPLDLDRRATSKSWAGTSNYFLQGLSADDQQAYLKKLASDGVKVIRLWVSNQPGNGACVKGSLSATSVPELETTIGQYNNETLDALDQTLVWVGENGLKAIISPHDGNKLNGANGNDIYGQTYGPGSFYEEQAAYDAYDARLRYVVSYTGKHSGKAWRDWSDVIMAFDLQNEPFAAKTDECSGNGAAAKTWVCGRSDALRAALGADSPIKIASGGFGGDYSKDCSFFAGAMSCSSLDIVAVHRYAGSEASNPNQWTSSYEGWLSDANGKLVFVEEWGVDTASLDPKAEFPANTADMNAGGLPWVYWQLLPSKKCDSSDSDGFGFFIDAGVDVAGQAKGAAGATSKQDWTGIVY
ncbi:LOW QUALITY PROTEIN: beta- -mannanase protein [Purpureocillium lavendulum]|uniref:mannan endo-1,4-beta-mannosidase n=1 Tax=Purpureocillium lavendulum TaxID=1247861 RepID=A0AB34FYX7_9HYPO|nr:LOW QUALITY PROTEIN: beta- -mannanase protein [Purpureocillium lavendulum]